MIRNALLQMQLFESAKETENKLRWDADVDETRFSLYIPKWRVPEPWPSCIWIDVIPRRADTEDAPNLTPADVHSDRTLRLEPIITTIRRVREHTKTIRYCPTGDPRNWEIGEPYIPLVMTWEGCELLRIIVLWDVTSRGLFQKGLHFPRYDQGIGSVIASPPTAIADVLDDISRYGAKTAGQMLGSLIEDELRDFAEATESELKFNRRNEYALETLLTALRRRLEAKLKPQHPAALVAKALADNAGFRKLCAHAKDPAIDITPEEVQIARDAWVALASKLRCPVETCSSVLTWADPEFRCNCGATVLQKLP